jgi:hypothetical protein
MCVLTIDVGGTNVAIPGQHKQQGQGLGERRKKAPSRRPARALRVEVSPGFEAASAS